MIWSYSNYRTFRRCPRQWFYKTSYASALSHDAARREAALLGKLQTISAWRGEIVDSVLSTFVIFELRAGRRPTLRATLARARAVFEAQRTFGLANRIRTPGLVVSKAGPDFAAFFKVEYGEKIEEAEFAQAWADIERALRTVWKQAPLRELVRQGHLLVAQRMLVFEHFGLKVRARPDLVVFFEQRPLIVDWKVHTFGTRDSGDQLTTYAIALARTPPHSDFTLNGKRWEPEEIELIEAQLLLGNFRGHPLSKAHVARAEERMAEGIADIQAACEGIDLAAAKPEDFPAAWNDQTCAGCRYRKLCWN